MEYMLESFPACFRFVPSILVLMMCGTAPSHAQSTQIPGEMAASERTLMAGSFATERLWLWQKRLNLEAWNISIVVSRAGDLKPKTVGNIKWDRDKKTAVIRILDPADYHMAFEPMLKDIEFTVVHELIHLEMSPVLSDLQRTEANRREEEFAVNHMTDALLKLDRGQ
jgi:hypothetical protein